MKTSLTNERGGVDARPLVIALIIIMAILGLTAAVLATVNPLRSDEGKTGGESSNATSKQVYPLLDPQNHSKMSDALGNKEMLCPDASGNSNTAENCWTVVLPPTYPIAESLKKNASAEGAPAEEAPVEEAPVEEAPVEEAPVEEAPVEEAPVEEAPVEEAPVEEAPVEEAPVEEAPVEDAPVEEAPVEDAPVEEAPVEDAPVEDAPDTLTIMTYQCDSTTTGALSLAGNVTGVETWSDGVAATYNAADATESRTLDAGVEYKMTFDGTYNSMDNGDIISNGYERTDLNDCLRSVDHWGLDTGVTSASGAFANAFNLTSVPAQIPSTITNFSYMFANMGWNEPVFNSSNISLWDTSKATDMSGMFYNAMSFNQPLNNWNTSSVTDMSYMFAQSVSFNQPLDNWDVSNVIDMSKMFSYAVSFNQSLNDWDTSSVTDMIEMFYKAMSFNQPLNNWDTSSVTDMSEMFYGASSFQQNLSAWDTVSVIYGDYFASFEFPEEYLPERTYKAL